MKKRILIIAMSFIVLVMTIAGATTAYFTDTDKAENIFTVGKVDILLSETNKDAEGNVIAEETDDNGAGTGKYNFGKVFPGLTYTKQPVITVDEDSESAFIGAVITIKNTSDDANIATILDDTNYTAFLKGINETSYGNTVKYTETADSIVIYIVHSGVVDAKGAVTLFDAVVIDPEWGNADMANLKDLSIVVDAYAVQTAGLVDENKTDKGAADALNAAFSNLFA